MSSSGSRSRLTRLASVAGVLIGIAGIAFVVRTLIRSWDDVTEAYATLNPPGLVLSLALGLGAMTWIGFLWTTMLPPTLTPTALPVESSTSTEDSGTTERGRPLRRTALSWYFVGQLGKYVPGAIWPIVGRAELAARAGVPRSGAYAATGRSMLTTYVGASMTVVIGSLVSWTDPVIGLIFALALAASWWVSAHEVVRARLASTIARVASTTRGLPDANDIAVASARHVPAWILMSLSTSVIASAFQADVGLAHMLYVTSLSWLIGFVVIGVPGGIGVREAVFISLLGPSVGDGVAASIAISSRVVFIAVDLVGAMASTLIAKSQSIRSARASDAV